MDLHNPIQQDGYLYMTWVQVYDPIQSNPLNSVFESFSCSLRYNQAALAGINYSNSYRVGYRGSGRLHTAVGKHTLLLRNSEGNQQVNDFPWHIDLKKSKITRNQAANDFKETCTIWRDFVTTYSDIPIKAGEPIKLILGYKVYLDVNW